MTDWHYYSFHDWSIGNKHCFLDLRWQITKKNTHSIVYNAGKKRSAFCSPISISKVCAWTALGGFPHLWDFVGVLVGFWWGFGWLLVVLIVNYLGFGSSSAHFWDFGGILVGLNGNQLVLVYSHVWWHWPIFGMLVGFWWGFDGVEWKSIGFSHSHVWWHWPIFGILVGFWWVLMGLNGNQLVLVIAMFGGTDPFLWFWWCFDRVIVYYSCVLIMFYWQPGRNVVGFL